MVNSSDICVSNSKITLQFFCFDVDKLDLIGFVVYDLISYISPGKLVKPDQSDCLDECVQF